MIHCSPYIRRPLIAALLSLSILHGHAGNTAAQPAAAVPEADKALFLKGKPPLAEITADHRELVLRFPDPIDPAVADDVTRTYPDLVDFVSTGYDQILIRAKRPLAYSLTPARGGSRLQLAAEPVTVTTTDEADNPMELRRGLTLARLEIQRGQIGQATMRLDNLTARYGERPDILALRAELAETRGAWRQAADNFRRAGALDRDNEYYADAARRMSRQGAPFVRADTDVAKVQKADRQVISVVQGQTAIGRQTDAGAIVENRRLDTDIALALNGTSAPAHLDRQRAEVYVSHTLDGGGALRGGLLADSAGTPGATLSYAWRDARQETRIGATYHRAYWELVSGIVNDGTQDSVEFNHERQFGDGWSGALGLRYNRYGIDGDDDVTRSGGLTGGLRKAFDLSGLNLSTGYGFDGEYIESQKSYTAADGTRFRPLDIGTREIHSLDVALSNDLTDWLRADLYGGYAYDRYNTGGPFVGGSLALIGLEQFEAGLRASRAKALSRGDTNDVTRAGAYAQLRF